MKKHAKPSRAQAEQAVRTLILWAGDNPEREGLLGTPERVVKSYEEFFSGYKSNPESILKRTFSEMEGYDDMVVLKKIKFESYCEHHIVPIIGHVHIGYIPKNRVVGISKLARVVNAYAKRLQIQEKFTAQVANCIQDALKPQGVGVIVESSHQCMTTRGVHKDDVTMITSHMTGLFRSDPRTRQEFLRLVRD